MSREFRIFCDHCTKEIKENPLRKGTYPVLNLRDETGMEVKDLCLACYKEIFPALVQGPQR